MSPVHADHSHCSSCAAAVEQNKIRRAEQEKSGVLSGMVGFTGSDAPPVGEFDDPATVFTEPMRRSEINQLIRVLRRARDQAFGKDE